MASLRVGIVSALAHTVVTARVKRTETATDLQRDGQDSAGFHIDQVACPVLSALVNAGHATHDSLGRVSQNTTTYALMQTGNTPRMAVFQSKGIAGFSDADIHQNERVKFSQDSDRFLNFFNMNRQDYCHRNGDEFLTSPARGPCNANVEFQQHGYSTLLRDPEGGGSAEERFNFWFDKPGVLRRVIGVGQVMTLEGLGNLLRIAREEGDHSGEFSTNPDGSLEGSRMSFNHRTITAPFNVSAVSSWQAVTAWSSFWAAFAHEATWRYPAHMTRAELKEWFVDGVFPQGYKMKEWGFRETFATVAALKGSGAGDEWCTVIEGVLDNLGRNATEEEYFWGMVNAIGSVGARGPEQHYTFPPGRD